MTNSVDPTPKPDATATFRPGVFTPTHSLSREALITAGILAVVVFWILAPLWPQLNDVILGDPDTDAIRGMWGFDHIRRSIIPPDTVIWSSQINFPAGVTVLILPWVSCILLIPIGLLFGPLIGWNLVVAILLWSLGMALAWLVRITSGSWQAGIAMGSAMIAQPMLLHAISDGTPEHLALWSMPLFLGLAIVSLQTMNTRWALAAGAMAIVVALDSPYNAIYTALASVFILPWTLGRRWSAARRNQARWTLGTLVIVSAVGAVLIGGLYSFFPASASVDQEQVALWQMNATDLRTWWQHDFKVTAIRDASLAPTTIPAPILWMALVFAIIGAPRSLPWTLAGLAMIQLSLGLNPRIPVHLSHWLGSAGLPLGETLLNINKQMFAFPGISHIRFPQRWLVPAAMMLLVGGGFGLSRILAWLPRLKMPLVISISGVATVLGIRSSNLDLEFPVQELPKVQFTEWIADQPENGALLMLPQMRPPSPTGLREDLPVFANIADSLSSSDVQYFQVLHRRAIVGYPSLKTITANEPSANVYNLLRDWDDLAHPVLTGNPIPESAHDARADRKRQEGIMELTQEGMRWIAIDNGAYNDEAMAILRAQLQGWIEEETTFDEGDGVLVFTLREQTAGG